MKFVNLKVCDWEMWVRHEIIDMHLYCIGSLSQWRDLMSVTDKYCESDMSLLTCICIVLYWKPFAMQRSIHLFVFLLSRLLEVLCTLYCLLSVHTLLFVISTYLELNSHFGERCDVSGVVVQLKKQSTLNLYMNNIVFFFF